MAEYQVLARKYRPQSFGEVLGQEAIVTTLKNAIKMGRLAHAYLFCGSRGTGKTTLARVFAKALNCQAPTANGEPCNACSTCREIGAGNSLDVLEIDGASHRGIDDIRQINETVGYASSSGKYKIYIIDEVHMLTKEAFNALLKTLEEPPPKVVFIFATTEPHKVLPTILSRCQRFNLSRIPLQNIIEKLKRIAKEQNVDIDDEAVHLLAQRAEGGLRDAESLFDQIIAFYSGKITASTVADVLGIMPKDTLFTLDAAGKEGRLSAAFEIAHTIFSEGKDVIQFVESMTDHFRTLLLIKLSGPSAPFLTLSESDKVRYEASSKLYTQEQCITILDFLIEAQSQIRFQTSGRIALEAILLKVMRSHHRLPVGYLVKRLAELEQLVQGTPSTAVSTNSTPPTPPQEIKAPPPQPVTPPVAVNSTPKPPEPVKVEPAPQLMKAPPQQPAAVNPAQKPPEPVKAAPASYVPPAPMKATVYEDPTPTPQELGIKPKPAAKTAVPTPPQPASPAPQPISPQKQSRYDTLLHFAAVELEGTVQKKQLHTH